MQTRNEVRNDSSEECARLRETILTMDCIQNAALDQIAGIAHLALYAMEVPEALRNPTWLAAALRLIAGQAEDASNVLNCEAESAGANDLGDGASNRRAAAWRAAADWRAREVQPMEASGDRPKVLSG